MSSIILFILMFIIIEGVIIFALLIAHDRLCSLLWLMLLWLILMTLHSIKTIVMANITVETIKAHLRAKIQHGKDCIVDMTHGEYWDLSGKAFELIKTRNSALSEVLNDIERGVLMTEEHQDNVEPNNDDIYHRNH